jgi:hypothetical protein
MRAWDTLSFLGASTGHVYFHQWKSNYEVKRGERVGNWIIAVK